MLQERIRSLRENVEQLRSSHASKQERLSSVEDVVKMMQDFSESVAL